MNELQTFKSAVQDWQRYHKEHCYPARVAYYRALVRRFGDDFVTAHQPKIKHILDDSEASETDTE